jgi:signal transduction histidine kinase
MNMNNVPVPDNEMDRIIRLSEFNLDYSNHKDSFKDLAKLAANIAGTNISLVNLIDAYTQWSISSHGLIIDQMPREDSVCQYTIAGNNYFEVEDLSADERFWDKGYVANEPHLRYYFGVPLTTSEGYNLGALCVLDHEHKVLSAEKIELLQIVAGEIINRLKALKVINDLKSKLSDANERQKKVAHDIRGPIGGIIGLAQIISEQGKSNQLDEVLEFINLIYKSGRSILELADEIMNADKPTTLQSEFTLLDFKDKLETLYQPQAKNKQITFQVNTFNDTLPVPFFKNKLLQIVGNLISNAIKFTPHKGNVTVDLTLKIDTVPNRLDISVKDTGAGMDKDAITAVLQGQSFSTDGTSGEHGYGFGLALVRHLVSSLNGSMEINTTIAGQGTAFQIVLPQAE